MEHHHKTCRLINALAPVLFLLSGCGGEGVPSPTILPHGDGSIPLGRAKNTSNRSTTVDIGFPDRSHLTVEVPSSGIVSVPSSIPEGPYTITITADESERPVQFSDDPKGHKASLFDVTLLPRKRAVDIIGVSLGQPGGIVVKLGATYKLKPTVTGSDVNGLIPSYWTSGGVGEISNGGVFKGVALGSGSVTVHVLGFEDTVPVTVIQ